MYNRYIPQSDGSFRRSRVSEQSAKPNPTPPSRQEESPIMPGPLPTTPEPPIRHTPNRASAPRPYRSDNASVSSFFKGLLPSNFDTEDLLVVLLLLLMSGNNSKDQNAALLTLGIYLFM